MPSKFARRCTECDIYMVDLPGHRKCPVCGADTWGLQMTAAEDCDVLTVAQVNALVLRRQAAERAWQARQDEFNAYYADRDVEAFRAELDALPTAPDREVRS